MKLIVGLGNHGKKYDHTRHNIGWDVISLLAEKLDTPFVKKSDFKAEISEVRMDEKKILLVHPLTYMNLSGEAIAAIQHYYKIEQKDVLIVHDEMDFSPGTMAFTARGRSAGHNGVSSIHQMLGTNEISRLRIGIGRPEAPIKAEDFVLEKFSTAEQKLVTPLYKKAIEAIEDWIKLGIDKSMNKWNGV